MNIKYLREAKGITQADLARLLDVEQSTVAKWETNKTYPRASQIPKIAEALECSIDDLFRKEQGA